MRIRGDPLWDVGVQCRPAVGAPQGIMPTHGGTGEFERGDLIVGLLSVCYVPARSAFNARAGGVHIEFVCACFVCLWRVLRESSR